MRTYIRKGETYSLQDVASVDPCKGFFMKQANHMMMGGNLFHHLHSQLICVGCYVGLREYRSKLVLSGSYFVVLGLCEYAQFPKLHIEILRLYQRRHPLHPDSIRILYGRSAWQKDSSSQIHASFEQDGSQNTQTLWQGRREGSNHSGTGTGIFSYAVIPVIGWNQCV